MSQHHSFTLRLMAFVKDRPNRWINAMEFEQFGRQAWRTRLSEARKRFEAARDGTIENRLRKVGEITVSEYRYVPALEAPASEPHDLNAWGLR